jgi:hypothetical protein
VELEKGLSAQDHARGSAGCDDDALAFDADGIHLAKKIRPIGASVTDRAKRLAHHGGKLPQLGQKVPDAINPRQNHGGSLMQWRRVFKQRIREVADWFWVVPDQKFRKSVRNAWQTPAFD